MHTSSTSARAAACADSQLAIASSRALSSKTYIVMAYLAMAYIVMAYIVMAIASSRALSSRTCRGMGTIVICSLAVSLWRHYVVCVCGGGGGVKPAKGP